jgi:hypothetical protein
MEMSVGEFIGSAVYIDPRCDTQVRCAEEHDTKKYFAAQVFEIFKQPTNDKKSCAKDLRSTTA